MEITVVTLVEEQMSPWKGLPTEIYALFTYQERESLHEYYLRFTLLLNDMNIYKMPLEQFQVNTKFLNTLPDEWSKFVTDVKFGVKLALLQYPILSIRPTNVEVPKELPKVSMVNTSLKKLKHHLANFDVVVKERTTPTAITEGSWGFEHTKACFRDEIIPFVKDLKDLFSTFNQHLDDELSEAQNVFYQMEQAVEQHRIESKTFEVKMNQVLNENERLLVEMNQYSVERNEYIWDLVDLVLERVHCVLRISGIYTFRLLDAACKKVLNLLKKGLLKVEAILKSAWTEKDQIDNFLKERRLMRSLESSLVGDCTKETYGCDKRTI
ncbi:hypothetical protein Tco_0385016 [Tanacetum coccineum]